MADNENIRPSADLLNDTSINMASDRARRISSLHRTSEDLVRQSNTKRLQVSSEISAITKQQQKMKATLELERGEMTTDIASGYSEVLKGLGRTINSLATGVKNITIDTGKATSDAISQYGKAVGEDISINKTNTIAMALSRSTPLFGYFAAKFMETDVFKNAATGIKDRVTDAMKEGVSRAGSGIANVFRRGKEKLDESKEVHPATVSDLAQLKRDMAGEMPKLQEGGYVKQGGVVEVHAAEVVTPIDKLLKQIDEAKSSDISRKLDKTLSMMSQSLTRLETVVVQREDSQKGLVQTFIQEFMNAKNTRESAYQERLLKAILELKVGLIGMTSRIRIAWQRTLLQHPLFRNILFFSDLVQTAMLSPIKFLFGVRGGYAGDVRGATRTNNVFLKISNLLAMTYTTLMPKLDDIALYTKATAEGIVGGPVEGATQQGYTMFGKIKEMLTTRSIQSPGEKIFDMLIDRLGLDRGAMEEAGITGIGGFAHPGRIMRNMGASGENLRATAFGESRDRRPEDNPIYKVYAYSRDKAENVWHYMSNKLSELSNMKRDQEDREGPHSPSMAENIAKTAGLTEDRLEDAKNSDEQANKIRKSQLGLTKRMGKRLRKMGSQIWDWLLFGFTFLKDMFFKGIGTLKTFLQPLITAALTAGGAALSKIGGVGGLAGGMSLAAGVAMGVYDGMRAVALSDEWKTSKASAAVGGFLGGTDKGVSGAAKGALKGGLIGAGIGSFFPVVGTAIGGAIGAIAGGILGFIGGENIASGIDALAGYLKKFIMAAWGIIKWPFEMIGKGFTWLKENLTWENIKAWAITGWDTYWSFITWPYKKAKEGIDWVYKKAKEFLTTGWLGENLDTITSFITWPYRKIKELWTSVKEFFTSDEPLSVKAQKVIDFVTWPVRKILEVKDWVMEKISSLLSDTWLGQKVQKVIDFVTWPYRKIKELSQSVKDFFTSDEPLSVKVQKITDFITWPMRKIMELKDWAKNKIKSFFSGKWLDGESSKISSFISWPMRKITELKDAAMDWIDKKFGAGTSEKAMKTVTDILTAPYDSLMNVFSWFGNLFDKIKEWAANKIKKSWLGRFFSDDEIDEKPKPVSSASNAIPFEVYGTHSGKKESMAKAISTLSETDIIPSEVYGTHAPKEAATKKSDAAMKKMTAEAQARAIENEKEMAAVEAFEKIGNKLQSSHNQTTAAVIQNTNVISSSNKNSIVNGGGGSGSGGRKSFSSGPNFAGDVVACNIK